MVSFKETAIGAVQAYWDRRPCNIRHSTAPIGSRQYFDEVEARKYFVEPHIPEFAQFERWNGKRVLEIGCGIGTDTINFARAGAKVTAVDLSRVSVDLARQRAEVMGVADRIQFQVADAERLSEFVEPEPYDLVYSFGVIHHMPHPEAAVAQVEQHFLAPGGTFKLMVYNRFSWKVAGIVLGYGKGAFWKVDRLIAEHSEAQTGCPVTYSYSPSTVRELLGPRFAIEDARVEHIFPYRVKEYVEYRYARNWYFQVLPEPAFRALEHRLGWHLCVTARAL